MAMDDVNEATVLNEDQIVAVIEQIAFEGTKWRIDADVPENVRHYIGGVIVAVAAAQDAHTRAMLASSAGAELSGEELGRIAAFTGDTSGRDLDADWAAKHPWAKHITIQKAEAVAAAVRRAERDPALARAQAAEADLTRERHNLQAERNRTMYAQQQTRDAEYAWDMAQSDLKSVRTRADALAAEVRALRERVEALHGALRGLYEATAPVPDWLNPENYYCFVCDEHWFVHAAETHKPDCAREAAARVLDGGEGRQEGATDDQQH